MIDRESVGPDRESLQPRSHDPALGRDPLVLELERQPGAAPPGQGDVMLDPGAQHAQIDEDHLRRSKTSDDRLREVNALNATRAWVLHGTPEMIEQPGVSTVKGPSEERHWE